MFDTLRSDMRCIRDRDPAARSNFEVLFCYPGFRAVRNHRLAYRLHTRGLKGLARLLAGWCRFFTGIEIHPAAVIGKRLFIDHGMGVVIGETAEVGCNVTIYHGVTLGGVSLQKGKRHPTIEDNVVIGAGAKILGAITIGENSRIGANAVVVKDVPPDSVVVGVPGQIVRRSQPKETTPDLHHDQLPDTIGLAITAVMKRLEELEKQIDLHMEEEHAPDEAAQEHVIDGIHTPEQGTWRGEDFMI